MKLFRLELNQEGVVGINFVQTIRWFFFYFFLELLFPILLDPLGLDPRYFGLDLEDFIELLFVLIIPIGLNYYLDEESGFANLQGFFIYFALTSFPTNYLYNYLFNDIYTFLIVLMMLTDIFQGEESETNHDADFNLI